MRINIVASTRFNSCKLFPHIWILRQRLSQNCVWCDLIGFWLEWSFIIFNLPYITAFAQNHELIDNLTSNQLHGGIIDNFILSSIQPVLQKEKLRIEREFPYSVTYGVAIRENAKTTEKCFRRYVHHYPQRMFETISKELKPVKVLIIYE